MLTRCKNETLYPFNKISCSFSLLLSNLLLLNGLRELSAKRQVSLHDKQPLALTLISRALSDTINFPICDHTPDKTLRICLKCSNDVKPDSQQDIRSSMKLQDCLHPLGSSDLCILFLQLIVSQQDQQAHHDNSFISYSAFCPSVLYDE